MKKCPICNIEFSDEAEFCPKCKAKLQEVSDKPKMTFKSFSEGIKNDAKQTDWKKLGKSIAFTFGFIIVLCAAYYLFYNLTR